MTEGHIFIQGIISPWQDKYAEDYGEVNIKQVTQQIQNNKDAEKLIIHIHSPGGDVDEGFGIHDILVAHGKANNVEIETSIEGLCASIATVIAMAGSTRMITENSEFMIHNPGVILGVMLMRFKNMPINSRPSRIKSLIFMLQRQERPGIQSRQ